MDDHEFLVLKPMAKWGSHGIPHVTCLRYFEKIPHLSCCTNKHVLEGISSFFLRRSWVDEWELGNSFLRESPCPDRQVVGQPIFGAIVGDSQDWESWVVETWWMQEMSFVWVSDFMFASCLYLVRHGERWRVKQIWFPDFFWLKTNTFAVYIENTFSPSWDECNSISTSASAV